MVYQGVHHKVPKKKVGNSAKPVHHVVPKKHVARKPGTPVPDAAKGPKQKKTKPAKPPGKPVESETRTTPVHHTIPGKAKTPVNKPTGFKEKVKKVWGDWKKRLGLG